MLSNLLPKILFNYNFISLAMRVISFKMDLLNPGEIKTISFILNNDSLCFYDN